MKTNSVGEKTVVPKDKIRDPLHISQLSTTDKENLPSVSNLLKSNIQFAETKTKISVPEKERVNCPKCKSVTYKDKAVQVPQEEKTKIEIEDLTSTTGPSEKYWEVLAERRRMALDDALRENKNLAYRVKNLQEYIEKLKEENQLCKEMLDETNTLVEVLQEMMQDDRSGINNSLEDSVL